MEEWKEYKLGEICTKIGSGATPKGGKETYLGGETSLIRSQNVLDFAFSWDGLAYINDEQATKLNGVEVIKNDVLLNITGDSVARVCIVPDDALPARVNQHVSIVRGNKSKVRNEYILYFLQFKKQHLLSLAQGGATRNALTKGMIEDFTILLPQLEEQDQIVSILKSLDDKIEVNRRINENLEQQAQALFKSWFVDFEPFKNGEFEESELGMIPKGWGVGTLFDVAEILDKYRKPLSGKDRESMQKIYPYYGATSCMDYVDNYIFDGIYTLIGEDGSVAKEDGLPYMQYVWGKLWVNNHAHILQGKNGFSTEMIHVMLSMTNIQHLVTGAVQAKLSQANMQKILLPIPPSEVLDNIRPIIDKMYELKRNNEDEFHRLATLRDTLLPKLMSGELKVNDMQLSERQ